MASSASSLIATINFAWREASSAAKRMALDFSSLSMQPSSKLPTWVYTPKDFVDIVQACADLFDKIETAIKILPIVHGLTTPLE
jgi:hypothetical protein